MVTSTGTFVQPNRGVDNNYSVASPLFAHSSTSDDRPIPVNRQPGKVKALVGRSFRRTQNGLIIIVTRDMSWPHR